MRAITACERTFMFRSGKTIDAAAHRAKLDDLQVAIRREANGAEADPFDEAMIAAVLGVAEMMKAESVTLAAVEVRQGKLARRD